MGKKIVLDEALVRRASRLRGIETMRGVILEGLAVRVQLRKQAQVRALRGQLRWDGDLATLRESREGVCR